MWFTACYLPQNLGSYITIDDTSVFNTPRTIVRSLEQHSSSENTCRKLQCRKEFADFAGTLITGSEHIIINSHPDTDDAAAYENPDEEAVAMIEKSPTTVAMLSSPAADDCGHGSSSWSMDCSTIVKVRTIHISSAILAAKSPFFCKKKIFFFACGSQNNEMSLYIWVPQKKQLRWSY